MAYSTKAGSSEASTTIETVSSWLPCSAAMPRAEIRDFGLTGRLGRLGSLGIPRRGPPPLLRLLFAILHHLAFRFGRCAQTDSISPTTIKLVSMNDEP